MDSFEAFARGEAARASGARSRVFDWEKAERLILERNPREAGAGLAGDWEWTGGTIWRDGERVHDQYTYLQSTWATPILRMDDDEIECWRYVDEAPGWDSATKWPGHDPK